MCGRRVEAERFVAEAIAVLQRVPEGSELAWAYSHQSQLDMLASRMDSAMAWGERALELARRLKEPEIIVHALGQHGLGDRCGGFREVRELEESFELAVAGRYHDHVERASCNLTCIYYWRRDYRAALAYIERGVSYATALELTHWEGYLRGWRSMVRLDQGCGRKPTKRRTRSPAGHRGRRLPLSGADSPGAAAIAPRGAGCGNASGRRAGRGGHDGRTAAQRLRSDHRGRG